VGNQSHPVKASHQPETSLAPKGATPGRSVDSERESCGIELRKRADRWGLYFSWDRGSTEVPRWRGAEAWPES